MSDLPRRFDIWRSPVKDGPISQYKDQAISKEETISPLRTGAARLRRGVLWLIFGLILLIPKVNRVRRRERLWSFVRIIIALAGVAIFAVGVARGQSYAMVAASALMLLFALVMSPERRQFSVDARARELGALIVVDGGNYIDASGGRRRTKLFLAPDRLWVVGAALEVLLEIPLQQIRSLSVRPTGTDCSLRVEWAEATAEFLYEGTFGEHLARVADATVRGRLYRELPVFR